MKQLKQWLRNNAYWITPLNTILIIIGISIGFWQRNKIDRKTDFSLKFKRFFPFRSNWRNFYNYRMKTTIKNWLERNKKRRK